ncbi:type VII toxin-antitoxin system MntA family adenylyltransferase antitoxin [Vibrio algarum]|uniref:Nucleotidyltransferase domain-containing protein n=1 Tax=Vibrio algarum TaxID=3020714 RepID=A0ABT4YLX1_9VIBR|nr:nucleotidyltransferase domain-containing protein [Vibrio sp. KJ40-1]MDB1122402.1 nucleotidyltransferase domain-containing protein [Vibrio sp. KJ40-1]
MDQILIVKALQQHLPKGVEFAYLFGSYASGRSTKNSDIDIAVFPTEPMTSIAVWESAQAISKQLNKDVDLINLMECNTVLRFQVVTEGLFLVGDRIKADFFETDTFRMYQDLQYSRQDNLASFVERWKNENAGGNEVVRK